MPAFTLHNNIWWIVQERPSGYISLRNKLHCATGGQVLGQFAYTTMSEFPYCWAIDQPGHLSNTWRHWSPENRKHKSLYSNASLFLEKQYQLNTYPTSDSTSTSNAILVHWSSLFKILVHIYLTTLKHYTCGLALCALKNFACISSKRILKNYESCCTFFIWYTQYFIVIWNNCQRYNSHDKYYYYKVLLYTVDDKLKYVFFNKYQI